MAYSFNGTSQYLSSAAPRGTYPVTMAAFANPNTLTGNKAVFALGSSDNPSAGLDYWSAYLRDNTSGNGLVWTNTLNDVEGNAITGTYSASTWAHIAGKSSSSTSRTAYFNGSASTANTTSIADFSGQSLIFRIGVLETYTTITGYFPGLISEVAAWSVALTNDEVASLSKGFKPTRVRPQSLLFYAPLIRALQDTRGGLTITNNNSATVADHPRVY